MCLRLLQSVQVNALLEDGCNIIICVGDIRSFRDGILRVWTETVQSYSSGRGSSSGRSPVLHRQLLGTNCCLLASNNIAVRNQGIAGAKLL